mmetsp:Transcript_16074/g.28886  ORF Transcript_16074/g.28886 Transcript_16074/m.28886 type:complete len:216 (+) Transcript_16074:187-834(+)
MDIQKPPTFWSVKLSSIAIQTSKDPGASGETMCKGKESKCLAVFDSGSSLISGPKHFVHAIKAQVQVHQECENIEELPSITLHLGDFETEESESEKTKKDTASNNIGSQKHHSSPSSSKEAEEDKGESAVKGNASDSKQGDVSVQKGYRVVLKPEDYVVRVPIKGGKKEGCFLGITANDFPESMGNLWILGSRFHQKYYTSFDTRNQKIGLSLAK